MCSSGLPKTDNVVGKGSLITSAVIVMYVYKLNNLIDDIGHFDSLDFFNGILRKGVHADASLRTRVPGSVMKRNNALFLKAIMELRNSHIIRSIQRLCSVLTTNEDVVVVIYRKRYLKIT